MSVVGYGVTAWSKCMKTGHLDGISVYAVELFKALKTKTSVLPMAFGHVESFEGQVPEALGSSFLKHSIASQLFESRLKGFQQKLNLFHATDHHIPVFEDVPVVATVMDLIPFLHPEWTSGSYRFIKNWAFKRSILSADQVITISEYSKQDLMRYLGLPEERISVIPLGVDELYFQKINDIDKQGVLTTLNLNPGFFLFIGTLQPRKNLSALLDAHALLPQSIRKAHPLVIVGSVGWKIDSLLSRLAQLEHEGTVRWLNYLPKHDVRILLQSALALMFVSLYEGFGLPVLEAFASNCPVIASCTTAVPEAAGDAAYLVDPLDTQAIADAMLMRVEDEKPFLAFQEKGRLRAAEFTWERCALQTVLVYENAHQK